MARIPKNLGMWLDHVSRLGSICDKNPMEVPLAISKGTLHKYISELVSSGMSWLPIKAQLQERFSKHGSATMAKHKLTQLKQLELPMHEYIANFRDMAEHAYSIKPNDCASIILASNFIEGVQNLHVKHKFRSYQVKNLKDIFGHAINENQKQKIRASDFGVSSKPESILKCDINAIKEKACFKCGSKGHFIKDCPLSQQDNKVQVDKYMDHRTDSNTKSTTDKVMEPLNRLFRDLVEHLRLLTPSGHSPHNGHPNYKGNGQHGHKQMGFPNSPWQHGTSNYHRQDNAHRDHSNYYQHQTNF